MGLELTDVATGEKIIATEHERYCKERHIRSMAGLPNKRHHRMDTHRSGYGSEQSTATYHFGQNTDNIRNRTYQFRTREFHIYRKPQTLCKTASSRERK